MHRRAAPSARRAQGLAAEERVARWLVEHRGCTILARNLRVGRDEVDIVAREGATLLVVEVRSTRAHTPWVDPLASVTAAKRARLRRAAATLLARSEDKGVEGVRIDVAALRGDALDYVDNAVEFSDT